jgi:signal transduction histidine kinase/ActR/RegA family two-component response regulator
VLPELEGQGIFERLDGVRASGEPCVGHSVVTMLDKGAGPEETFFDFVYQPLFEGSAVAGIAVVCFDVTALAQARREAEAANRAKDEFLAMLGHELRNPLAPILTALQLMKLKGLHAGSREREVIERQVRHLVGLVDDLLDVSRITRGKIQLRRETVELADVVSRAVEMASPAIEQRRHTLTIAVPRGLAIDGDQGRLAQVFANLLTNAAKYTDRGGRIEVSGRRENGTLLVTVADNGSGIGPGMMPRLFRLFSQERQELDRSQGGLGLGLAIVRGLVEAHGGSVAADSAGPGKGATFTVRLPAAAPQPVMVSRPPAPEAAHAEGRAVLVVDDNRDAAELLADSLRRLGHLVQVATDGPSALELVRNFTPDVALLDLGLPVMDGFELAGRLRQDAGLKTMGLVAITGYGQDLDRRRSEEAGFHAHLVKPVDIHTLHDLIQHHSSGRADRGATR